MIFFALTFLGVHQNAPALASIDTTFTEIRSKAIQNSPDIMIAKANAEQKNAQLYTSWSRLIPRLDMQLMQSRSKDYSFLSSGTLGALVGNLSPQATSLYRWDIGVSMPLYKRAVHLGIEQSSSERRLALNDLNLKETELDSRLRSLIGHYLLDIYREITLQNAISIAQTNLKEAELRFELGQRTKVDLLRAKSHLVSLESQKLTYFAQKEASMKALLSYSGMSHKELSATGFMSLVGDESETLQTIDTFTKVDEALNILAPNIEKTLDPSVVTASPVYEQFIAEEELSSRMAKNIMSQEWPELLVKASLNKQADGWDNAFASGNRSYSAAVLLNIPLFSGGSLFSTYFESTTARRANLLKAEKKMLDFRDETENERLQIKALLSSLEAQKITLAQNDEIVRLSFKSYQLGKATMTELLGAQNDLIASKINLAKVRIDLAVLVRRFAWNLGVTVP